MTCGRPISSSCVVTRFGEAVSESTAIGTRQATIWFLALAVAAFAAPGIYTLGRDVWSTEQGAQGPIILATGLWLLWRELQGIPHLHNRARSLIVYPTIVLLGLVVVFGSVIGKLWLHWAATYFVLVVILFDFVGTAGLRRAWFPLFYLMFLIPPPPGFIVPLTRTLKLFIADWAVDLLALAGYAVAKNGASLYIDSYELVVAAACSGLNSLVSLLAIGLLYAYLRHRADWRYASCLAVLIIPVAILTNLLRVLILLLVTHYAGNEVAQSMLHEAAGLIMFVIALFTLGALDVLLAPIARRAFRS